MEVVAKWAWSFPCRLKERGSPMCQGLELDIDWKIVDRNGSQWFHAWSNLSIRLISDFIGFMVLLGWSIRGRSGFCLLGLSRGLFISFGVRNWKFSWFLGFADFGSFLWGPVCRDSVLDLAPPLWWSIDLLVLARTCSCATLILLLSLIIAMTFILPYATV